MQTEGAAICDFATTFSGQENAGSMMASGACPRNRCRKRRKKMMLDILICIAVIIGLVVLKIWIEEW